MINLSFIKNDNKRYDFYRSFIENLSLVELDKGI